MIIKVFRCPYKENSLILSRHMLTKINLDITYNWGNYRYFKTTNTFKISFIENVTHLKLKSNIKL